MGWLGGESNSIFTLGYSRSPGPVATSKSMDNTGQGGWQIGVLLCCESSDRSDDEWLRLMVMDCIVEICGTIIILYWKRLHERENEK